MLLHDFVHRDALLRASVYLHAPLCSFSCLCASSCAAECYRAHSHAAARLCAVLRASTRYFSPPCATAPLFVLFCVLARLYVLQRDATYRREPLRTSACSSTSLCTAVLSCAPLHASVSRCGSPSNTAWLCMRPYAAVRSRAPLRDSPCLPVLSQAFAFLLSVHVCYMFYRFNEMFVKIETLNAK